MLGVIVNTVAVILGSALGLLLKKGIPERVSKAVMIGVGLATAYIAIDGMNDGVNPIIAVVSLVIGAAVGTLIDIDKGLNKLGDKLSAKAKEANGSAARFTEGFVTASLLFCVGAMAIMGSITAGLTGDNATLYTKSILDFTAAIMLTSTFGIGVMLAAVPVFIYQGAIALCAGLLQPLLTDGAVAAITCVGSIVIFGLAFNIMGISKFKIANYLPAIILAPFVYYLSQSIQA